MCVGCYSSREFTALKGEVGRKKKKMCAPKEKVMIRVLWEGREMTNSFRGLLRKYP